MKPSNTGIKRITSAIRYSLQGLKFAWENEEAFRQESVMSIILLIGAVFLSESAIEYIILIVPVFIVLIVELLNSAIEAVVDRISDEKHTLSGAAKDTGSAAVFVSILLLIIVWIVFIYAKFLS